MADFPFAPNFAFSTISLVLPPNTRVTAARVDEYLRARLLDEEVPDGPEATGAWKERTGFCFLGVIPRDGEAPLELLDIGDYLAFGWRVWDKTPPSAAVRKLTARRVREWESNHAASRAPKSVREEIKFTVELELRRRQAAKVRTAWVVVDTRRWVLYTSETSAKRLEVLLGAVRDMLRTAARLDPGYLIGQVGLSLEETLERSRGPGFCPPAHLGNRWLLWLARETIHGHFVDIPGEISVALSMGDHARLENHAGDGTITVSGQQEVVWELVQRCLGVDARSLPVQLELTLTHHRPGEENVSSLVVRFDAQAHMLAVSFLGATTWKERNEDLDAALMDRIALIERAALVRAALLQAFDATRLTHLLREAPQQPLFKTLPADGGTHRYAPERWPGDLPSRWEGAIAALTVARWRSTPCPATVVDTDNIAHDVSARWYGLLNPDVDHGPLDDLATLLQMAAPLGRQAGFWLVYELMSGAMSYDRAYELVSHIHGPAQHIISPGWRSDVLEALLDLGEQADLLNAELFIRALEAARASNHPIRGVVDVLDEAEVTLGGELPPTLRNAAFAGLEA